MHAVRWSCGEGLVARCSICNLAAAQWTMPYSHIEEFITIVKSWGWKISKGGKAAMCPDCVRKAKETKNAGLAA